MHGPKSEIAERLGEAFRSAHDRGGLRDRVDNLLSYRDYDIGQSRYLRTLASLAPRMRDYHSYCNAELLAKDYLQRFDRLSGELEKGGAVDLGDKDRELRTAKAKVELFRQVTHGGFSDSGTWGWRKRPTQKGNRLLAVLWLSQGSDRKGLPNRTLEAFLRHASLQSVDTAIKEFRGSVPPARRSENRAAGHG